MIREIFIIQKESSILITKRSFMVESSSLDSDLFSGAITAISNLMQEIDMGEIQHFQTGEYRMMIIYYQKIIMVGVILDQDEDQFLKTALKKIVEKFWIKYSNEFENWDGNTKIFQNFGETMDKIVVEQFTKRYISLNYPKNMIKIIKKFQQKFNNNIIKLIGIETGKIRGKEIFDPNSIKQDKDLLKLIKKELNLFSINKMTEINSSKHEIVIELCPICRGIKNANFSCKFLEGFIQGIFKTLFNNSIIFVNETKCCAHGDKECIFEITNSTLKL